MPLTTLALIPARSGSKGIPGKNLRVFRGRPLLSWAIWVGQRTCDRTFVTTDDMAIGAVAAQYDAGVILRPHSLATDETPMLPVVQHALEQIPYVDVVVLLQPTQPFRKPRHVREALGMLEETGADSVVSVVEAPAHYWPMYASEIVDGRLYPYLVGGWNVHRRQDAGPPAYSRDGTVYAIRRETIERGWFYGQDCRPLVIPRSESVNLDTEDDWKLAEAMKRGA